MLLFLQPLLLVLLVFCATKKETHSLLALRNCESRCRKLPKQPYRSTSKVSIIGIMSPPFLGRPKARS